MGSLTKAGKVRSQTPKIEKTAERKKTIPRVRYNDLFHKRIKRRG